MDKRIILVLLILTIGLVSAIGFPSSSTSLTTYSGNLTNISQMQDVNIPTPTDAYVLTWNSASGKWIDAIVSELDPKWTANYSTFLTHITWANVWNGSLAKTSDLINYNSSGLIKDWNASTYIKDWNATGYIKDWTSIAGISWANAINGTLFTTALFNTNYTANDADYRSITNTSYYLATNPFSFYNVTTAPIYLNDTFRQNYSNFTVVYGYALNSTDTDTFVANYSDYLITKTYASNDTNWNATGLIKDWNADGYIQDWNSTGYIKNWDVNGYIKDWNSTGYIKDWQPNIVSANTTLKNWIDAQAFLISFTELDPKWTANYSLYNNTWSSITNTSYALESMLNNGSYFNIPETDALAYNGTLMFASNWNATNTSYALDTKVNSIGNWTADKTSYSTKVVADGLYYGINNPYGYYNSTSAPIYVNDTFAGNYSTFLTHIDWSKVINGTLMLSANWNATNTSYYLTSNPNNYYNSTTAPIYINDTFGANYSDYLITKTYASNDTNYNSTGLIKDWNATGFIKDFNATGYIKNWVSDVLGFGYYNSTNAPIYLNDTFRGTNYTTFLTHITWANAVNGTLFTTALFNTNYTANDANYRTTYNSTYDAFNSSGLIKDWNASTYIKDWNSTGYIKNWNADNYIKDWNSTGFIKDWSYLGGGITWANAVNGTLLTTALFNTNYTANDLAYRDITNTSYYLASNPSNYINWGNAINGTLFETADWNTNYTSNNANWLTTYNSTYDAYNSTGLIRDWNASTYIKNWNATGYIKNWNATGYIKDWNATEYIKNWQTDITSTNTTMKSYVDGTFLTQANYNTNYTTLARVGEINTFTQNQAFSNKNLTGVQCVTFNTGGKICGV